ncbi:hypothetical protein Mapa_008977 [Marchantia paleacea]|nr:hypothetical protein Mapa_008977 [Marchantia paleacea]
MFRTLPLLEGRLAGYVLQLLHLLSRSKEVCDMSDLKTSYEIVNISMMKSRLQLELLVCSMMVVLLRTSCVC